MRPKFGSASSSFFAQGCRRGASRAACHSHLAVIDDRLRRSSKKRRRTRFDSCRAMRRYFRFHPKMKMSPENRGFRDSRHWRCGTPRLRSRLAVALKIVSASRCDCHRDVPESRNRCRKLRLFRGSSVESFYRSFWLEAGRFCRAICRES